LTTLTRQLCYSNGGQGGQNVYYGTSTTTQITLTNASLRIPIRLPASTDWWQLNLRVYDALAGVAKTPVTGQGIMMGAHAPAGSGAVAQTGSFTGGVATSVVSSPFTIPGDGTFYSSPQVTTTQFQDGQDFLIAVAFNAAASTTMQTGIGSCWRWADTTSAVNPAIAGSTAASTASWIPIDWVLQYQTTNAKDAFLVVGDSISEGTVGPAYALTGSMTNAAPTPLWHGQWERWAARRGDMMVQRHCLYASSAQEWSNPAYNGWGRQYTGGGAFTGAALALGANDIKGGRTLAQLQADYINCLINLRAIVGGAVPVYALTVMPESMSNPNEGVRLAFNNWLGQLPAGITDVIDVESEMRSTQSSALDSQLTCDSIHPSHAGQRKLTDVLMGAIA
jgi:hypothetical protein